MIVYYIEKLTEIGAWGDSHYKKVSPLFTDKESAENYAKEHKMDIYCKEQYSDYHLRTEKIMN